MSIAVIELSPAPARQGPLLADSGLLWRAAICRERKLNDAYKIYWMQQGWNCSEHDLHIVDYVEFNLPKY